jgi:hypothetical protein
VAADPVVRSDDRIRRDRTPELGLRPVAAEPAFGVTEYGVIERRNELRTVAL